MRARSSWRCASAGSFCCGTAGGAAEGSAAAKPISAASSLSSGFGLETKAGCESGESCSGSKATPSSGGAICSARSRWPRAIVTATAGGSLPGSPRSETRRCARAPSALVRATSCARAAVRTPSDCCGSEASAASSTVALRGIPASFNASTTVAMRARASSAVSFARSTSPYAPTGSAAARTSASTRVIPTPRQRPPKSQATPPSMVSLRSISARPRTRPE